MGKGGALDDALASFAMLYARRTRADYDMLLRSRRAAKRKR